MTAKQSKEEEEEKKINIVWSVKYIQLRTQTSKNFSE
jgi:hypothetical protein